MEFVRLLLLFVHFVGLASLIGGFLVQMKGPERRVTSAILHGVGTQLVSGILLVGVDEMIDHPLNRVKVGVKLLIALVILVAAWVTRKPTSLGNGLFFGMFALSLANVAIAVFWV